MSGAHAYIPTIRISTLALLIAAYSALWGGFLLLPFNTFQSSPTFQIVARLMPDSAWGVVLCSLAATVLIALHMHRAYVARAALGALAALWLGIAVLFLLSNPTAPAWISYGSVAISTGAVFWRLR